MNTSGIIIIAVVAVIFIFALKSTFDRLRGKKTCCGSGGNTIVEQKKLTGEKLGEKRVSISGMHCEHCVANVTHAINRIDGATATVNLKKNEAVVSFDKEISDEDIIAAVEREGYEVLSIA